MPLRECCRAASVRGGRAINKIEAPESRRWGKKLNSYPLPAVPGIAQKDHAALLFLLGLRMNQDEHLPVVDFVLQQQQSAVRVHHHGFANLFELAAIVPASLRLNAHLVKDASATSRRGESNFAHTPILGRPGRCVNRTVGLMFPTRKQ